METNNAINNPPAIQEEVSNTNQQQIATRAVVIEVGEHLSTPYRVQILWGAHPEDDADICEYRFATQAEFEAFFVGVETAEGWMGFEIID